MLRLDKVLKPWRESAALNDHINLYGFWNETTFVTKSGDLGMVLHISGVDYESLDGSEQEQQSCRHAHRARRCAPNRRTDAGRQSLAFVALCSVAPCALTASMLTRRPSLPTRW